MRWLHNLIYHSRFSSWRKLRAFKKRGGGYKVEICWCGNITKLHDGVTEKPFWDNDKTKTLAD